MSKTFFSSRNQQVMEAPLTSINYTALRRCLSSEEGVVQQGANQEEVLELWLVQEHSADAIGKHEEPGK